jgi:hypothetical protein
MVTVRGRGSANREMVEIKRKATQLSLDICLDSFLINGVAQALGCAKPNPAQTWPEDHATRALS